MTTTMHLATYCEPLTPIIGAKLPIEQRHALREKYPDAEHPVVRTHPETGEKILFVNTFTTHLVNYHIPSNIRYMERTGITGDVPF